MSRYSATETHFALLTIGEKRSTVLENELNAITSRLATIEVALSSGQNQDSLVAERESALAEMESIRSELADETLKLKRQAEENVRRKHNYVPLAMALLKHLAKRGKLNDMVASAEQRRANSSDSRSKK
jgi:Ubiquitin carboxyl-terminal hydrolases